MNLPKTMIMTRWNMLSSCALVILAAAVVYKNREVSALREQARQLSGPAVAQEASTALATKPRGERPDEAAKEGLEVEFQEDEEDDPLDQLTAFGENGGLSKAAIDALKLTQEEALAVGDTVRRFRTQAAQDLADRLKPKEQLSDEVLGNQRYYARARRDRGQALFDSLTLEFGPVIGQDRSRRLVKSFAGEDLFASLCKQDLDVEVIQPTEEDGEVMVKYQLRSPRDGSFSRSGGATMAEFEAEFGKLFEEGERSDQ
jgi:hypothetical protein